MGKRLHVAKRYEIEYGNHSDFNWMTTEVQDLFRALGMDIISMYETDEDYYDMFEVSASELYGAISDLKNLENLDEEQRNDINCSLEPFTNEGYHLDEIIQSLEYFIDEADKKSGYVLFSFF